MRLTVDDRLLVQSGCEERLQLEHDRPELCLSDLSFHLDDQIQPRPAGPLVLLLSPSVSDRALLQTPIYLIEPLKSTPPFAFWIWSIMQVIDFFSSFPVTLFEKLLLHL